MRRPSFTPNWEMQRCFTPAFMATTSWMLSCTAARAAAMLDGRCTSCVRKASSLSLRALSSEIIDVLALSSSITCREISLYVAWISSAWPLAAAAATSPSTSAPVAGVASAWEAFRPSAASLLVSFPLELLRIACSRRFVSSSIPPGTPTALAAPSLPNTSWMSPSVPRRNTLPTRLPPRTAGWASSAAREAENSAPIAAAGTRA
mmetsp:Transcript_22223/g.61668  ORF Transcript_22223/g.61668 Transcript_22223/m.61668 type:complete len:205 (+) Transcript_22223:569-1183(+)